MARPMLDLQIQDVITIGGDLYVKSPEALEQVLTKLKTMGYDIQNLREDTDRKNRGVTVEKMEKNRWSLWFANLTGIDKGKCNSCNSYISRGGIRWHGHRCEVCGEVTYYEIIDGSIVEFYFIDPEDRSFFPPRIRMKAHHWDAEKGELYLYILPEPSRHWRGLSPEEVQKYLNKNRNKWSLALTKKGLWFLKVKYHRDMYIREDDVISMCEIFGHQWNHRLVKLWEGQEYSEFDHLPVPEMFSIYETWHWAPLKASPTLHEDLLSAAHQVSDQGYYYQDGRSAFSSETWLEIGKFVRNFTTLDADAYDRASRRFRLSGPGGIADLAKFCHPKPEIENKPNIGNALVAASKFISGQPLTDAELDAGEAGAAEFWKLLEE